MDQTENTEDLQRVHLLLKPEQVTYLLGIGEENMSAAARKVIDNSMNNTLRKKIQQSLLYLVLIITLITLLLMLF